MKRAWLLYYFSRLLLSALVGCLLVLSGSAWWLAAAVSGAALVAFVYYAHSGRYLINLDRPLFPLRRDARGRAIRDRAVVLAVCVAGPLYAVLAFLAPSGSASLALLVGLGVYFAVSNWMYVRR